MVRQRVLVVDPSEETPEVLRTALRPRNVEVVSTDDPQQAAQLAHEQHVDVIVFDCELSVSEPDGVPIELAHEVQAQHTPVVLIGAARYPLPGGPGCYVRKPYHYAPLIRRIERLLDGLPAQDGTASRAA